MPADPPSSTLLLDEYFELADERFLDELLGSHADKKLAAFAAPWLADPRPFARKMLLAFVDDGCDRPAHRPLAKRIFKHAESSGDDALMGHFLVAFDRLSRRKLKTIRHYDYKSRQAWTEQELAYNSRIQAHFANPQAGPSRLPGVPFTRTTRQYLERRVWRYFRRLGFRDPPRYGRALRDALLLYPDRALSEPLELLDAWGLLHALYGESPVLVFKPRGARVAPGRTLKELVPAPMFPETWRRDRDGLFQLLERAPSRTVRAFVLGWLRAEYADSLRALPLAALRPLLRSRDPEVQGFGVSLLSHAEGLDKLPVTGWLELLGMENPDAVPVLIELVRKHVAPERLTLAQRVSLALAPLAPVAGLGLSFVKAYPVTGAVDVEVLLRLLEAPAPTVRAEATTWLAGLVSLHEESLEASHLRAFFDSRFLNVRAAGRELLGHSRFRESMVLWAELSESPYDDVRAYLVPHLEAEAKSLPTDTLRAVWAATLLAVHRGSRAKSSAAQQVAERIVARPAEAASLLPLLAVTLRSIRAPERRAALVALTRAALAEPSLRSLFSEAIPELRFSDAGVTS